MTLPYSCVVCRKPIVEGNIGFVNHHGRPQHQGCATPEYVKKCLNANKGFGYRMQPQVGRPRNLRLHEIMAERNCSRQTAYKYLRKESANLKKEN